MARHGNSKPRGGKSLQSEFPEIAKLWHPKLNGDLLPSEIAPKSNTKIWWLCPKSNCECGHIWQAPPDRLIRAVTKNGTIGCPFCKGRVVCKCNSFGELHPTLATLWHPSKNGDLTPYSVAPQSNKKVWWKCQSGPDHEWQTAICTIFRGSGCPFCSKPPKKVSITNCMFAVVPDAIKFWNEELNNGLTVKDILPGSTKKYWWKCPEGDDHVYQASPEAVTTSLKSKFKGHRCPFCAGNKVSNTNRLSIVHPELVSEWHPSKNGELTPHDVTFGTGKKVWWKCPKGSDHEWKVSVAERSQGRNCPFCSGKRVSSTNSLPILYPHLVKEWHPTKNGNLKPEQFTVSSGKKVWWKCDKGIDHEWKAQIASRASGRGCRFCANRKGSSTDSAVSITNSLATKFPEIAAEWHPTLNGDLTPEQVIFGTQKKYWWQCKNDPTHVWKTDPSHRTGKRKSGCPSCAKYGIDKSSPTKLYSMRLENHAGIWWWKAGISVDPERRAGQIRTSLERSGIDLDVVVNEVIEFETGQKAIEFEQALKGIKEIRITTLEIFSGNTELFSCDPLHWVRMNKMI
ncbi:zinc-ribbon domain-containing protein [Euryarchaeota archaeon]|nr:zinc-ribbon domain-containing protein [Euryarchaeota archaeon]